MKYRLLFAGDLHKRMKDITTIRGYAKTCIDIELDLMSKCKELGCTHFISLGDWFDRGYGSDVSAALAHTDIDNEFSKLVNGNFYGIIGNHIRINMDSNPELFLIQPHKIYTSRHRHVRREQIIKTPDVLMFNGVQISFMHYNKEAQDASAYIPMRGPETKYHIAIYHTPYVIPTMQLNKMNMLAIENSNDNISKALKGVDFAIVGDIHKPFGTFRIDKADGTTTMMCVPGSLTNTDAGLGSRHDSIDMPLIDIGDNGEVTISYVNMDLRLNQLTFLKKELEEQDKQKLRSLRGNNKNTLYEKLSEVTIENTGSMGAMTFNAFMLEQNYTPTDKQLVRLVMSSPDKINEMVKVYKQSIISV